MTPGVRVSTPALPALSPRRLAVAAWTSSAGRVLAVKLAMGLLLLGSWEATVRTFGAAFIARPTGVIAVMPAVLASPGFQHATVATLVAVAQGLAIALAVGTLAGLALGRVPWFRWAAQFYVNGLYAVPMTAILPPMALWLGFTETARLGLIAFAAFFPIALNTADGAQSVPREYLEVGNAYCANRREIWFGIALPSALPYLLSGVRLAAGRALIAAVVAEFFVSIEGLGSFILFQARTFHHNEACVGVFMLAAFGVAFDLCVTGLTRRFFPWYRRSERAE
jgi:ABC-type nitrate/sulfonate/bicarbonate transport system permease component